MNKLAHFFTFVTIEGNMVENEIKIIKQFLTCRRWRPHPLHYISGGQRME